MRKLFFNTVYKACLYLVLGTMGISSAIFADSESVINCGVEDLYGRVFGFEVKKVNDRLLAEVTWRHVGRYDSGFEKFRMLSPTNPNNVSRISMSVPSSACKYSDVDRHVLTCLTQVGSGHVMAVTLTHVDHSTEQVLFDGALSGFVVKRIDEINGNSDAATQFFRLEAHGETKNHQKMAYDQIALGKEYCE